MACLAIEELELQGGEEAFGHGVVEGVPDAAHRAAQAGAAKPLADIHDVYCDPWKQWCTGPGAGRRRQIARRGGRLRQPMVRARQRPSDVAGLRRLSRWRGSIHAPRSLSTSSGVDPERVSLKATEVPTLHEVQTTGAG